MPLYSLKVSLSNSFDNVPWWGYVLLYFHLGEVIRVGVEFPSFLSRIRVHVCVVHTWIDVLK